MTTTYATEQDFIDAFGLHEIVQLSNLDDPMAQTINSAKLIRCQQQAKSLIDGLIAGCQAVAAQMPFALIPPLLTSYELDIARYLMDSIQAREDVRKRYEDALQQLRLIGRCEMSLGLSGGTPQEPVSSNAQSATSLKPSGIFSSEALCGY
jgi:phage gp36-like protein